MSAEAGAGGSTASGGEGGEGGSAGEPELGPPPAGDTCADAVDVNDVADVLDSGSLLVSGTNVNARADLTPCDGLHEQLPDVVYRYTAPATGGLRWALGRETPTLFLADVRTTCGDVATNLVCDECGVSCGQTLEVSEGDTLYFVVFGVRTTNSPDGMGSFDLVLELSPDPGPGEACVSPYESGRPCAEGSVCQGELGEEPFCGERVCGDGLLSFDPLECDDGNDLSGDGCSSECMADGQGPGGESCADPTTLHLPALRPIFGDTVMRYGVAEGAFVSGSDLAATCGTAAGSEAVYVFELMEPAHVEIGAENIEVLSVRAAGETDCGSEELACASGLPDDSLTLALDLEAGRYSIILDREEPTQASSDDYSLTVVVNPPQ